MPGLDKNENEVLKMWAAAPFVLQNGPYVSSMEAVLAQEDLISQTCNEIINVIETFSEGKYGIDDDARINFLLSHNAEWRNRFADELSGILVKSGLYISTELSQDFAYPQYEALIVYVNGQPICGLLAGEGGSGMEDSYLSIFYDGSELLSATSNDFSTITLSTANTYLTSDILITVPSDFSINVSYFSYDTIIASASGTTITLQTANKILEDDIVITQQ